MAGTPITSLPGSGRLGLLADTHCEPNGLRLPARVFDVFAGVDLILHLGDCGDAGALDELQRIALVLATRGGDDQPADPRYAERRVVEVGGLTVGALFDLARIGISVESGRPAIDPASIGTLAGAFERKRVDVVAFAATHQPLVAHSGGVLLVNPGSATLPATPGRATVALLECRNEIATVEIVAV